MWLPVLLGALIVLAFLTLPCPDPNPPPTLMTAVLGQWMFLSYLTCGAYGVIYAFLPGLKIFFFHGTILPLALLFGLAMAYNLAGATAYALFLFVQFAISLGWVLLFVVVSKALTTTTNTVCVAVLAGFVAPHIATANAIGFAQSC